MLLEKSLSMSIIRRVIFGMMNPTLIVKLANARGHRPKGRATRAPSRCIAWLAFVLLDDEPSWNARSHAKLPATFCLFGPRP
jgi:hypothetical protein